ncbi:MAG TPA: D-aminoacyl-tRNA deacylase, partial [Casimicrobiaceae bacterium]|nr:D-aminoacyl-tRNA deacylase [Casimicrobiaceae bacterium]
MRALLQRVREASVTVDGNVTGAIGTGLLVFVGVTDGDSNDDRDWLVHKIVNLRIFDDDAGVMNRSIGETGGNILAVSQFTLYASTKKGQRPSWSTAARPDIAQPIFNAFVATLSIALGKPVATGVFGAQMRVAL